MPIIDLGEFDATIGALGDRLRAADNVGSVETAFGAVDWDAVGAVVGRWPPKDLVAVDLASVNWSTVDSTLGDAHDAVIVLNDSEMRDVLARTDVIRDVVRDIAGHASTFGSVRPFSLPPADEVVIEADADNFEALSPRIDGAYRGQGSTHDEASITGKWPPEV